jgi:hypothetical protein
MATLTGTRIANTYKQLLQVGSSNTGLTGTVQAVQDGGGNASPLELSQNAVNINGTFQLSGVTLTANASTLNAVADLTGATGIVAVSAGNVYGRTITGGTGVSITNGDGTEGNPTIALNTTGVVSASYGPATNIEVNAVGQIVSAGAATSVSVSGVTANTFTGGTFAGTTGDFSSNVSVGGNLVLAGQFSPESLSVTGTINANKILAPDATFNNIVSAGFFVGDGSGLVNVPSIERGTVKFITAGTGIKLTVDAAVTTTIPVSGTVAVSANQNFGTVSVSTALAVTGSALFGIVSATNIDTDELLIAGVSAATVNEVAAVSALTQTNLDSITSINIVVANVSALTSVNAAAITSINAVIEGNVSADSGTFNTLTVVTSASVGGTFNVGGNVGIGTSSPDSGTPLHVQESSASLGANPTASALLVERAGTVAMTLGTANTGTATIFFGDPESLTIGRVQYDNSDNALQFWANSLERMRIDSSGRVGIGTASPDLPLAVSGSIGSTGSLFLRGQSTADQVIRVGSDRTGNGYSYIDLVGDVTYTTYGLRIIRTNGGENAQSTIEHRGTGNLVISTNEAAAINFDTHGAERMRIDSSGNLLVGTTSATTDLAYSPKLKLSGNGPGLYFEETDTSQDYSITALGGKFYIRDATAVVPRLTIDSSGRVGIGTSSPSTIFHIDDNAASGTGLLVTGGGGGTPLATFTRDVGATGTVKIHSASGDPQIVFEGGNTFAVGADGLTFKISDNTAVGTNDRLTIDSSGNVGIGTSSPSGILDLSAATGFGTLNIISTVNATNAGNKIAFFAADRSDTDEEMAYIKPLLTSNSGGSGNVQAGHLTFGTFGSERMRISSAGLVGIGTSSPARNLTVNGSIQFASGGVIEAGTTTLNTYIAGVEGASGRWAFATNGSERMRIDSSGNVGINTTSGNEKLNVHGAIGSSSPSAGFGAGLERIIMDYTGSVARVGHVNGASGSAKPVTFLVAGAEKMRLDSSGNLTMAATQGPALMNEDASNTNPTLIPRKTDTATGWGSNGANNLEGIVGSVRSVLFGSAVTTFHSTAGTEVARIDRSTGNVMVGKTSAAATFDVKTALNQQVGRFSLDNSSSLGTPAVVIAKKLNDTTTSQVFVQFLINSEVTGSGQINANGSSAVAFGSYSDERLKENIVDLPTQLENICSLRPVEFDYKAGGHQIGFIAQEMQSVYPDVVGSGSDDMLTITGWSKTEARLVKALQEAVQKIEALEARITSLEAN